MSPLWQISYCAIFKFLPLLLELSHTKNLHGSQHTQCCHCGASEYFSFSTLGSKCTSNLLFIFGRLQLGIWPETCFCPFGMYTHTHKGMHTHIWPQSSWQVSLHSSLKLIPIISSEGGSYRLNNLSDLCAAFCFCVCHKQTTRGLTFLNLNPLLVSSELDPRTSRCGSSGGWFTSKGAAVCIFSTFHSK